MSENTADLGKAARKSLSHHFHKSAAHHEAVAAIHEKCMKAHEGAHAHHEEMGKAEGAHKEHHKAKMAFHKTMASHHEHLHKRHMAHAEHHKKMAESMAESDAEKCLKLAGFESTQIEEIMSETVVPPTTAAPNPTPAPVVENASEISKLAAAQAETNTLLKALIEKISTPAPVATPQENEGIAAARRAAELTSQAAPLIRSFAVPRTGDMTKAGGIEVDAVDPELADLVSLEHVE